MNASVFGSGEEQMLFHEEHSTTIILWTHVEGSLGAFVGAGQPDLDSASAIVNAFWGIESSRAKIEFADRYLQSRLATRPNLLKAWLGLCKRIEIANRSRNAIVHWTSVFYMGGAAGRRFALVPTTLKRSDSRNADGAAQGHPPGYALAVRDIIGIRYAFFALAQDIDRMRELAALPADVTTFEPSKAGQPPTISQLRDQVRSDIDRLRTMR